MDIFQAVIDLLRDIWESILPIFILKPYEEGVHLRCGKFFRTIDCGLWWKIPFFDSIDSCNVAMTTLKQDTQSLTTKDGKNIVVRCAIKYRVQNVKVFLIEVEEARDALEDMTMGIVKKLVSQRNWDECKNGDFENEIYKQVIKESVKWGIRVLAVTLVDLGIIKSHRLMLDPLEV